MDIHEANLN